MPQVIIKTAHSAIEMGQVRELFQEYAEGLGFSLDFQDFDQELKTLPGAYAPPSGVLLLAIRDGQALGCVGLRLFENGICEMKRLYVRPDGRGLGLGRALACKILERGREMGYDRMRLDTLANMVQANRLYDAMGFYEIPPYRHNPMPGVRYLEVELSGPDIGERP